MTRIESLPPGERQALKEEIKKELKRDAFRAKLGALGGCGAMLLVAVGALALLVASVLARTGFYDVPLLSRKLYKPSAPTRVVQPLIGGNAASVLMSAGTKAKLDQHTGLVTLTLTETDITTVVQESVATAKKEDLPFPVRAVQVVLEEGYVEVFAVSPQNGRDATVRIRFLPVVETAGIDFQVREVRLGDVRVPDALSRLLFGVVNKALERGIAEATGQFGTVYVFEMKDGLTRIQFLPRK